MDEVAPEYDVVVLGTGLTECVLSGVMSVKGKKVLHIDRNDHYGGESASLNIEALFKRYGNYTQGEEPWKKYGRVNDWNVDLVPKLLMSNGELTNILVSTDVTRYLEFKQIAGSYVQQGSGTRATVAKVPSDAGEALRSPLMGLFEKRRAKRFLEWVGAFKEDDPSTYGGLDLNRCTMKEVYDKFGLEATTRDFIGHSMALYQTDEYINQKGAAKETVVRIRLYANSMARYGKSPYIYPLYGLGELPQGFARLSAIYGGTYMLNTNIDEIEYEGGKVSGIKATMRERSEDSDGMKFSTRTKKIIADPSYFPGKVQVVAHLLKAICILTHPVANTENSDSAQLIIPQSQVGRRNDIYIAIVSSAHNVCPKGYYIAIVSTIAEGSSNHHLELQPGFDRLGKIEEKFMGAPIPLYEPLESGRNDNIFISKSYDATSHFETTTDDVRDIYRRAEQEELVVEGLREGDNLVGQDEPIQGFLQSMRKPIIIITATGDFRKAQNSTTSSIPSPSSSPVPGLDPGSSSSLVAIGDGIEHSLDRSISTIMPLSSDCPYEDFPGVVRFEEIDDEITVYVGEKERKFKISKNRLQPILPHIELDDYESHHLPDVDERTFELFEHWLRNETLDELNQDNEEEAKATMLEYLDLYFEATEWGIQDLENIIMDRFRGRHKCEDGYFPCFLIKKIYDNTEERAPLRRYMVDEFLFKSASWAPDHLAESFNRHSQKGNNAFLLDCYNAALNLALAEGNIADADFHVELGESPRCEYHKHRDGKECGLERARKRRKVG